MATTAAMAPVTTGTTIKTMLQLATPTNRTITIISWGWQIDALPTTTLTGKIELIETDVAATMATAHVAAGVQPLLPGVPASLLQLGTTATGFSATAEGTPAATRTFDQDEVNGATFLGMSQAMNDYQFMQDERPVVAVSKFLRVRATFGSAVNLLAWVCFEE
jgi:hypothetical protein